MENEKYYIAVNAGDRYPLLKTPQDYTEYFNEALSFGDLFDVLRYIEKHGLLPLGTWRHTPALRIYLSRSSRRTQSRRAVQAPTESRRCLRTYPKI